MSYGSKVCPHCNGEMRVYFEGDGSSSGRCPTCDTWWSFGPMQYRPTIDPKGAFYEVIIDSHLIEYEGPGMKGMNNKCISTRIRSMESLGMYTSLEAALKRVEEIKAEARTHLTDTSYIDVTSVIKRWNHDRTEWEFWRPEYAELDKEVFA